MIELISILLVIGIAYVLWSFWKMTNGAKDPDGRRD
jgi:hypothetical protein